jgi:small multidrug resistance pump
LSPWLLLGLAIVVEVIGAAALRDSHGFTRPGPSAVMVVAYAATFYLMSLILKQLPLGVAYAVWSGVGTLFTALLGWTFYREAFNWTGLAGIVFIIVGVIFLNLSTSGKGL